MPRAKGPYGSNRGRHPKKRKVKATGRSVPKARKRLVKSRRTRGKYSG